MTRSILLFLLCFSLNAMAETELTGDAKRGQSKSGMCTSCHGVDGNSLSPSFPKIAGQGSKYFVLQLKKFKSGERKNAVMAGMVKGLSEQDMHDLAAYYASKPVQHGTAKASAVELGGKIYRGGIAEKGVAACQACHGPQGKGNSAAGFPALSGQHALYTVNRLKAYREMSKDEGSDNIMAGVAKSLSDEEIKAVAQFTQGLH